MTSATPTGLVPVPTPPRRGYAQVVGQLVDRYAESTAVSSRLRMLLRESAAVVEELSLPALHRRIVESARALVSTPAATLAVLDPDGSVVQLVQRDDDLAVVGCLPLDPALADTLTRQLREVVAWTPLRMAGDDLPEPWSAGCTAVAVHHRRDVLAVLLVVEPDGGLADDDEDVLLGLAASAGTAIENARLYEEARRRQEWMQEAAELSSGTLAMVTEVEALALVGHSVQKLADAEVVTVWVPELRSSGLQPVVGLGDRAQLLTSTDLSRDDPLVADVLAASRGSHLEVGDRPGSACLDALAGLDVGPVMVLPVLGSAGLRGLLLVGRHVGRPRFGEIDLDMAETFLNRVALVLELAHARAEHQRVAQLEDRDRIAHDLREHVVSWLLATGTKVQSAAGASPDLRVRSQLQEVVGDIDTTLSRLRDSIFRLGGDSAGGSPTA